MIKERGKHNTDFLLGNIFVFIIFNIILLLGGLIANSIADIRFNPDKRIYSLSYLKNVFSNYIKLSVLVSAAMILALNVFRLIYS